MVDRAGVEAVLKPIKVGPEMAALRRFLPEVVTWEGTIHEGGMDRAPRRCAGSAGGTSKLIQDGRWIAGNYEQDQFLEDGTFVLTWQLHWVAGWAPQHGEYRPAMADNYGNDA